MGLNSMACDRTPKTCPSSPEFWADNDAFKKAVIELLADVADGIVVNVDDIVLDAGTNHIGEVGIDGEVTLASDTTIAQGRKTVASAGTPEALVGVATPCKRVDVQALSTNTGIIVVGGAGVVAAAGTRTGIALEAKQTYSFSITDLANVYIDATVDNEGVSFTYFN